MTREELLARLRSIEWSDIEFKEAAWAVPRDALSTVSAFANTEGGYLVFGVKQANGAFTVAAVVDADNVQNDFLGQVRDRNKISVLLPVQADVKSLPEGTVLVFFVPEAARNQKPVFLDGNPKKTFIRRGARDDACTSEELLCFIRDAASDRFDSEPLDVDLGRCFDPASIRWYRARFAATNPGKDDTDDDPTFLRKWGFVVERSGVLRTTRAAVLVLGADEYVRQILPRMVVDLQLYRDTADAYSPDMRWADRLTVEENLIKAWQAIVDFYFRHSERPFSIDAATLRRDDDPPDYISFREAAINLLIHQDFGDLTRVPAIRLFRDRTEFFNPGDAFASREELLDPGDKQVRNPSVVSAFRRVALSDQGGTGVGAIFANWRRLGYVPPEIENSKGEKSFRLRLRKQKLQTEAQLLAQASLGVRLTEHQAAVFAYLLLRGEVDVTDIKGLTGLGGAAARVIGEELAAQVLAEPSGGSRTRFALALHLRVRFGQLAQEKTKADQGFKEEATQTESTVQVTAQVPAGASEHVRHLIG